jgi:nicotinamidase-related amidase
MDNLLIVVDCQNDFVDENGSMYVKGADEALHNIAKLISSGKIDDVIFTVDWHPETHESFIDNGGQFPRHCVHHTWGAALKMLPELCNNLGIPYYVREKGKIVEEFGAFTNIVETPYGFDLMTSDGVSYSLETPTNIIICGVAGDFCVLSTLKQLAQFKPQIYLDGVASIYNNDSLIQFMKFNNCHEYIHS